ncbi:MAG: glycosyltransferase [Planctomycetota bacterium]
MKRIKILYLIDKLDTGGTQRHLVDLVTSIDRTVFEPRVVCLMSLGALAEELISAGIAVRSLNLRRIYDFRAVFEAIRLARVVRDECIPIIHSYLFSANLFGMLVSRLSGTYLIISKRDLGFEDTRARKFAARLPARFADIVTANSHAVAGHLRKDEGIPREKIRIIYNGVKIPRVVPGSSQGAREALMRHPNWSPYRVTVGTVANLKPVKNHRILLYAARRVLQRFNTVQFLLVGDGPDKKRLARFVRNLGIERRVIFFGETRDVSALHGMMDVFVLPSLHEGFPNALIEAMAAGVPAIATNRGGCTEAIMHGLTGFLFDPENAEELARDIVLLLRDEQLRNAVGKAGMFDVENRFPLNEMVRRHEQMYVSLLRARFVPRAAPARRTEVVEREYAPA